MLLASCYCCCLLDFAHSEQSRLIVGETLVRRMNSSSVLRVRREWRELVRLAPQAADQVDEALNG